MSLPSFVRWLLPLLLAGCLVSRPDVPKLECELDSDCAAGTVCGPAGRCTAACKADLDCPAPAACQAGACTLPAGACARETDCPAGDRCVSNRCARACAAASDCGADEACVGGACLTLAAGACARDSDCPAPSTCQQGACALPAGACARPDDCALGQVCVSNRCARGCAAASDCAAGEACVGGACLTLASGLCALDSDCPAAQACVQGRCAPACATDRDCTAPFTCQQASCALPTGACARSSDCAAGQVCSATSRCAAPCATAVDCAVGEACVGGACVSLSSGACRFNSECPPDRACVQGRCAEACLADRDCPFGTACANGLCAPSAPECLAPADCQAAQGCSPQGRCVTACATGAPCAAGEACSNGVCVRVGADTAGLAGAVSLTGVADASGLQVRVDGPNRASAVTAPDGGFVFQGLVPGLYTVTVTAGATVEGTASREVAARAGATTAVPGFTLTPAGDLVGTVRLAGRGTHEGVQVAALGTGAGTVSAPDGTFALRRLPLGSYDVLVAFPGYTSAQAPGVAVRYAQATSTGVLTLQPVPAGSTFAFSSVPPTRAFVGQPLDYQAVAGGGGATAVTYALVDGPPGMTVTPATGQVSWLPTAATTASVVLSATSGGATVYQLFSVAVSVNADLVFDGGIDRVVAVDGGAWLLTAGEVFFLHEDGGTSNLTPERRISDRPITSLEHLNGRTVTEYRVPGGTLSRVSAPFGTLAVSWEGAVVGSLTGADLRTVQAATLLGGVSGTASAPTGDRVAAVTWPSGAITSLDAGVSSPTGFRANSGIVGPLTSTGFTDPAATWTPNVFNPDCVSNAAGTVRIPITSHTDTTFILDVDPSGQLATGQRYFITPCAASTTTYTFFDANRATMPSPVTNRSVDVYAPGLWIGNFALTASTQATVVNGVTVPPSISFSANISLYAALANAAATGFYALGATGSGVDVTVTDTSAPWTSTTHTTSNFLYDDFAQGFDVVASTPTTLTVRQPFGSLLRSRDGRGWVLADTTNNVETTIALQGNSLLAADGGVTAVTGQHLWVDPRGESFAIVANTASAVTVDVPLTRFPLQGLVGGAVGRSASAGRLPSLSVPTAGLVAGAHARRAAVRFTNDGTPFVVDSQQAIISNGGDGIVIDEESCSSNCVDGLSRRLAAWSGRRWAPGATSPSRVEFRITLTGSPGFAPESLRGRLVVLEPSRASGTITANDQASFVVEVDETNFNAFRSLTPGAQLSLSDAPGASGTVPLRVQLVGQGAAWTANQWAGASVVTSANQVAGVVVSNDASTLELSVTSVAALANLLPGFNFAFARPWAQGTGCATPGAWVRADLTLAGAALVANAYTHVRSEFDTNVAVARLPLASNSTAGAAAFVCATSFSSLLNMQGRLAVFENNGRLSVTLEDATAAMTPNAFAGRFVSIRGSGGGRLISPIQSNTDKTISLQSMDSGDWLFNGNPKGAVLPGARYLISDAANRVPVVAVVSTPVVGGALANHVLRISDGTTSTPLGSNVDALVSSNTASELTLPEMSTSDVDKMQAPGSAMLRYLNLSRGTVVRLVDQTAAWTPGALVGRTLDLGPQKFIITENATTTLVAVSPTNDAFGDVASAATYSINVRPEFANASVRADGTLVLVTNEGRIAELTPRGGVRWVNVFSGARRLSVRMAPFLAAGVMPGNGTNGTYAVTWSNPAWSFGASIANAYLRVEDCLPRGRWFLVRSNSATSVTAWGTQSCNGSAGRPYAIDPATLVVSGATLAPGELRDARLWINGYEYRVRDNTTDEIFIRFPDDYFTPSNLGIPASALDVVEAGGTAWVLDGPAPLAPGLSLTSQAAATGAQGIWFATASEYALFDGVRWASRAPAATTDALVRTGVVSAPFSANTIVDTSGTLVAGALVGKRLLLEGRVLTVESNTTTSITMSGGTVWPLRLPLPGTPYQVYEPNGYVSAQAMAVDGSRLWVGATNGLYRLEGTAWTRFTSASTESAVGAADGLLDDDVSGLWPQPNGDLYVGFYRSGVSRLRGSTWTALTPANTESGPGLGDGLPNSMVNQVVTAPDGASWFVTFRGAARLSGNTWRQYGEQDGLDSFITGIWFDRAGQAHLANQDGLFRLRP